MSFPSFARIPHTHADRTPSIAAAEREALTRLAYELLDAHDDTTRLADELTDDRRWRIHLDYLRDLQRTAREQLAHAHAETGGR